MIRIEDVIEKVERNRPNPDVDLIRRAYLFSALHHKGQKRASGEPYLVHPLEVADLLAEMRLDEVSVSTGFFTTSSKIPLSTSTRSDRISAMRSPSLSMA